MTPENENAYTPEVEDERRYPAHPFTEDEPVTSGPAGTGRVADGPLSPDGDEPLTPTDEEPLLPADDEPLLPDADERVRAETGEPMRAETGVGTGAAGGQPVSVAELGPIFDGSEAGEFQQNWQQIQSGFVEDPASAVRRAEDLTDKILTSLTRALEDRRQILDNSARNGDTEQLRLVLRQYREVLESVTSL
jgi:hypothetical protein